MAKKFKIRKGDKVIVTTGREKGKTGDVLRVLRSEDRVLVQGVNMVRRHQKPSQINPGGVMEKEATLHISNIALIDPKTDKPTRVGYRVIEGDRKVRFASRRRPRISGQAHKLLPLWQPHPAIRWPSPAPDQSPSLPT